MTVKELCAMTNSELAIAFPPNYNKSRCWASKTKSLGTENQIPDFLLNYEVDSINIETDPWDIKYLEIFLKTP